MQRFIVGCRYLEADKAFRNLTKEYQAEYIDSMRRVIGVYDYKSALLFSVETMSTIGFSSRVVTTNYIAPVFLLLIQCIIGIILQTVWTAVLIAKFKCTIADFSIRFSHHPEEWKIFAQRQICSYRRYQRHVMWHTIICHEIDRNSPLHDFTAGIQGSDNCFFFISSSENILFRKYFAQNSNGKYFNVDLLIYIINLSFRTL